MVYTCICTSFTHCFAMSGLQAQERALRCGSAASWQCKRRVRHASLSPISRCGDQSRSSALKRIGKSSLVYIHIWKNPKHLWRVGSRCTWCRRSMRYHTAGFRKQQIISNGNHLTKVEFLISNRYKRLYTVAHPCHFKTARRLAKGKSYPGVES